MNLSQFLPSVHFAISQLKDGSEDAQMHSFYLSKLAAALTPTVVESTPENRQDRVKRLFIENGRFGASAMSPVTPEPATLVIYGDVDIKLAYAAQTHYGLNGVNFMASMIVKGVVNTVTERPQYEIEGVTIMSVKHCTEALGL